MNGTNHKKAPRPSNCCPIFTNYGFLFSLINMMIEKCDFIYSICPLHMIQRKCQLSCPDMRHVKMGRKSREKNSWGRECIFSSHRPQKSMKNLWINIKEEKFKILLENWSRYRSEEISPYVHDVHTSAILNLCLCCMCVWCGWNFAPNERTNKAILGVGYQTFRRTSSYALHWLFVY